MNNHINHNSQYFEKELEARVLDQEEAQNYYLDNDRG